MTLRDDNRLPVNSISDPAALAFSGVFLCHPSNMPARISLHNTKAKLWLAGRGIL